MPDASGPFYFFPTKTVRVDPPPLILGCEEDALQPQSSWV